MLFFVKIIHFFCLFSIQLAWCFLRELNCISKTGAHTPWIHGLWSGWVDEWVQDWQGELFYIHSWPFWAADHAYGGFSSPPPPSPSKSPPLRSPSWGPNSSLEALEYGRLVLLAKYFNMPQSYLPFQTKTMLAATEIRPFANLDKVRSMSLIAKLTSNYTWFISYFHSLLSSFLLSVCLSVCVYLSVCLSSFHSHKGVSEVG